MKKEIYLILDNIRSSHNVGSILRTCEGLGIINVLLCGYTPYPLMKNDLRLPHIANKATKAIKKTSLGAEISQRWEHWDETIEAIDFMKNQGYEIVILEQANNSINLTLYKPTLPICLVVGNEITGVSKEVLAMADYIVNIPMQGIKESFNVANACAMGLFYLTNML